VVFQDRRKTGLLDLEAIEMAVRSAMHQAGAAVLVIEGVYMPSRNGAVKQARIAVRLSPQDTAARRCGSNNSFFT